MTPRTPVPGTQVQTVSDLLRLWEGLMGSGGFDCRSLWILLLDPDSRAIPVLLPVDDLPSEPTPDQISDFVNLVDMLLLQVGADAVALLLSRPGGAAMTDRDRRWATALREGGSAALRRWPIHLATKGRIAVFAPDDVVGSEGASSGVRAR